MNGEEEVLEGEGVKKKMKEDAELKEMLRHDAKDAATKTVAFDG